MSNYRPDSSGGTDGDDMAFPAVVETWDSNGPGVSDDAGEGWDPGAGAGTMFTDTSCCPDVCCVPGTGGQQADVAFDYATPSNEVGEVGQASRDLGMPYDRPWLT